LFRFAQHDAPVCAYLRRAFRPLTIEYEEALAANATPGNTKPERPETSTRQEQGSGHAPPPAAPDLDGLLHRLCDWLDAVIHLETHCHWHLSPQCFDPDPEKRRLAILGSNGRCFATLPESAKARWQWLFREAADQFKGSAKWPALGMAMAAEADRPWPYPDVDQLVIYLWPLVTRHNWTYHDLLAVLRPHLKRPDAYPCSRDQEFATYCANVLALRKTTRGTSAKNSVPPAHEIATHLLSPP
jgi:hypothetical protein